MRDYKHNPFLMTAATAGLLCTSIAMSPDKFIFGLATGLAFFGIGYGYFNKQFPENTYLFCSTLASASAIGFSVIDKQNWVDALSALAVGFIGAELGLFVQNSERISEYQSRVKQS